MKTKINHFDSGCVVFIVSIISLAVWIHSVQAVPPGLTYQERRALTESDKNIKVGMSYAEIQANTFTGPMIESTGFELSDGFDPPNPATGFNGFICGPEFADCDVATIDQGTGSCVGGAGDNCCIDNPNPDNGWYISISSGHCKQPHIDNVNPASGEQHLRFTRAAGPDDGHTDGCIGFTGACRISTFSPYGNGIDTALPVAPHTISIDVASTGRSGSSFIAWFLPEGAPSNYGLQLYFLNNGGIYYYENGSGFNYLTEWIAGDYGNLTVSVDPCNRITKYIYNGNVVLELSRATGVLTENDPWINRSILATDNGGEIWDVDNFSIERGDPCPTTCGADGIEHGEECEFEKVCFGGNRKGDPCESDVDCPGGECLEGDYFCPGRCNPPGTENECICTICSGLCNFTDLPNGTTSSRDVCASSGWYTFVADTPATAIETCGSEGFDSFLVVFTNSNGSDDCQLLDTVAFNDDCDSCEFGDGSDPLASCYDSGIGPCIGFPGQACLCVPTTIGQRYWVWEKRGGEILDANIRITKTKRLTCEEVWENGTCCDDINGVCTDEVASENCTGDFETYSLNKLCVSPSVTCEPITGACCDRLDGFCSETIKSECSGVQPLWTPGVTCGEVVCDPAMGACCNTRFGSCSQEILANCTGEYLNWTKGDSCNDQTCPDPFIPAVSQWGLIVLTLLLLIGGKIHFNRRNLSAPIS